MVRAKVTSWNFLVIAKLLDTKLSLQFCGSRTMPTDERGSRDSLETHNIVNLEDLARTIGVPKSTILTALRGRGRALSEGEIESRARQLLALTEELAGLIGKDKITGYFNMRQPHLDFVSPRSLLESGRLQKLCTAIAQTFFGMPD